MLGIILSRKFGLGVKTDGFFAAYGIYLALVLVAGSLRVIVAAALCRSPVGRTGWPGVLHLGVRARTAARRAGLHLAVWPDGIAHVLSSEPGARDQAAVLLPWVVVSAVAQILGGLVASALAALDDYQWAAFGFAVGSVVG